MATKRDLRIAELENALAHEKQTHTADNERLEGEIQNLKRLLTRHSEEAVDRHLHRKVRRLERALHETAERLASANRKAAAHWIEKVALETRTTYSPFTSHRGVWLAAFLAAAALLVWAYRMPF